tara:strand:- start:246 stop:377 length:132 start_codon:yes stop_codon:yes gene_type:complete
MTLANASPEVSDAEQRSKGSAHREGKGEAVAKLKRRGNGEVEE